MYSYWAFFDNGLWEGDWSLDIILGRAMERDGLRLELDYKKMERGGGES